MKNFFFKAKTGPAFGETLLLTTLLLLMLMYGGQSPGDHENMFLVQGILFFGGIGSIYLSIRLVFPEGKFLIQLFVELVHGVLWAVSLASLSFLLLFVFSEAGGEYAGVYLEALSSVETFLFLSIAIAGYFVFRVIIRIIAFWDGLRRRKFLWSLTTAQLIVVLAVAFLLFVLVMLITSVNQSNSLLEFLLFTFFPTLGISGLSLVFITIAVLPFLVLISYMVARKATERIDDLAAAARSFSDGNYNARSAISGEDEIASLQGAFNDMADSLTQSMNDLRAEKDTVTALMENRRNLIANVSHDLRTPVATIQGYLDSFEGRSDEFPDDLKENLEIIKGEAGRLKSLIDDLFLLSRAEADQLTVMIEPVEIKTLFDKLVVSMKQLAWERGRISLESEIPENLSQVAADPERLYQVLLNLLSNAIRHTPPGGIIILRATESREMMTIEVCDTGPGIPAEALPHIWDRFYKHDANSEGAGLGLAIVRELVHLMHGTTSVQSEVGEGACFSIMLSLYSE